MDIDREWFSERLQARKLSQRGLAKLLELDPSAITLAFKGQRKFTNGEANQLASILGVSVAEVLRRAGVPASDDVRRVPIAGTISAECAVTLLPAQTHDLVVCPADVPAGGFALQMRASANMKDRWLYFVSGEHMAPDQMLDKYVVAVTQDGRMYTSVIRRGYKAGTFNLLRNFATVVLENETLSWVSPILWVRPL